MIVMPSNRRETITREELVEIVGIVLPDDCAESTKQRLLNVAVHTEAVAVGWFHCDGVRCPARQAGRHNQAFQTEFDRAMGLRFGREINDEAQTDHFFDPFVVVVED